MHKSFSFLFLLVFVAVAYSQPVVDIPLTGTDGTLTINLAVGLDPAATNGIDPGLGESDLPPFPPAGAFEIRFDLTPYAGQPLSSYKDYRFAASFPYSGQVEHKLIWQTSGPGLFVNISYTVPAEATMTLKDTFGGVLFNSGPLTGSGTYTVPVAAATAAIVTMDYTAVPVELTSFEGSIQGEGVLLKWTTATELNNQGFEIERSTSELGWSKIGYVPGHGSTTEPNSYSFMDNDINTGIYNYRLKQIDFSGEFTYSDAIEVVVDLTPHNFDLFQNYPNPFNPSTTIQFQVPEASNVSIVIYNMLGQEVKALYSNNVQAGNYSVDWNGTNNFGKQMSSGTYIYRMTAGNFVETKEMILLK